MLLASLILMFGNVQDLVREHYRIEAVFPSAGELSSRSPVKLGGARIGRVDGKPVLTEAFNSVVVQMRIYDGVKIPAGSEFEIGTAGVMGDAFIDITPPDEVSGEVIAAGTRIEGAGIGGLGSLTDTADKLSDEAMLVMADVRDALKKLNGSLEKINTGLLADDNLESFRGALAKMNNAIEKLDSGVLSEENQASIKETLANLNGASEKISKGAEQIEPLLSEAKEVVAGAKPVLENFGGAAEQMGEAAEEVGAAAEEIRGGDGLVAALLSDEELKKDFAALVKNLREHGVVFYRDRAEEGEEDEDPEPGLKRPVGRKGKPPFKR